MLDKKAIADIKALPEESKRFFSTMLRNRLQCILMCAEERDLLATRDEIHLMGAEMKRLGL